MSETVDFSRFTGVGETELVTHHNDPRRELRSPAELERPDYYQRRQECQRDTSSWAGSSMGGGTWAGRTR
jgi:hypothetical protein